MYDEKTNEELLKLQKQLMKEQEKNKLLEDENKVVKSKLKKILKKRSYHKFNDGPAFYIFSTKENEMDVRHLAKGVYYLRCGNEVRKAIIE